MDKETEQRIRLLDEARVEVENMTGLAARAIDQAKTNLRLAKQFSTRVAELSQLVYAPGQLRCPKCGFVLIKNSLNMRDGTVTAGDTSVSERCNNDGTLMVRVTERQLRKEMEEEYFKLLNKYEDLAGVHGQQKADEARREAVEFYHRGEQVTAEAKNFSIPAKSKAESEEENGKVVRAADFSAARPKHPPATAKAAAECGGGAALYSLHDAAVQRDQAHSKPGDKSGH